MGLHKGSKALHTAFSVEGFRFTGFRVFGVFREFRSLRVEGFRG